MSDKLKAAGLLTDLDRLVTIRQDIAKCLDAIAKTFTQAESEAEKTSGQMGLQSEIERLTSASESLRQNVFRLMVLGDMKRGKSTFLNALLGQNLLPSDVTPCTALLTVLKYGASEKVTIHYSDGKPPAEIDFPQFKERYTIDPKEAKLLEQNKQLAFPDISHAVVEHPLPLLRRGIEFVDSPGLNDTETRNQLSLGYIYNCHAILFVMSAGEPCTLEERRYLQNYLLDRGLSIFFLINGWDRIREKLIDPEDTEALQAAHSKLRQVFQANLADYCHKGGRDIYQQRVFEISALQALRARLKNPEATMEGTGFPEFIKALNRFLIEERGIAEMERAYAIGRSAYHHFHGAIERRIPLLDQTVEQLKQKIDSVQSDFDKLSAIGNQFQQEIRTVRDRETKEVVDSFKIYILGLEDTFEKDFLSSQPDLDFMQFLDKNNRAMFYTSFKRAFERYINDRLAAWEFMAKQKVAAAFSELDEKAAAYRFAYAEVLQAMNDKLIGDRFYAVGHRYQPQDVSTWSDALMEMFSSVPDQLNGAIRSFNMFWQSVLFYACVTIVLQLVGLVFASVTLSLLGGLIAGLGMVALQAEYVRRQFIEATKKEFVKYLPKIAEEQSYQIELAIKKCFNVYSEQVGDRINADINSRKAELDNLLKQKESKQINRDSEIQRLRNLDAQALSELQLIESVRASI